VGGRAQGGRGGVSGIMVMGRASWAFGMQGKRGKKTII